MNRKKLAVGTPTALLLQGGEEQGRAGERAAGQRAEVQRGAGPGGVRATEPGGDRARAPS